MYLVARTFDLHAPSGSRASTDVLTMITVGNYLAERGSPWTHALPFIALTVLLVGIPLLLLLAMDPRAGVYLPRARGWMDADWS